MENKSFTLIEALTSIFIIVLISGIIFVNYRQSGQQLALQRSANKLSQDLRRVQQMAMSVKDYTCPAAGKLLGFGVYFTDEDDSYLLKARCDSGDKEILGEELPKLLEKGVKIEALSPDPSPDPLKIFFYPPDPKVIIEDGIPSEATITLSLKTDTSKTKKVTVNKIGLIEIK